MAAVSALPIKPGVRLANAALGYTHPHMGLALYKLEEAHRL
jgi:hypothetical protein